MRWHLFCSVKNNDRKFYDTSCPITNLGKRGKYEWLDVYVELGYFPLENKDHLCLLTSNLLCYDAVNEALKTQKDSTKYKHVCVACLFGSNYVLMLSSVSSTSQSPGFEALMELLPLTLVTIMKNLCSLIFMKHRFIKFCSRKNAHSRTVFCMC